MPFVPTRRAKRAMRPMRAIGEHRLRRKNTTAAKASKALRLAKRNAQSIEINHYIARFAITSFSRASTYTIDGIDMTAATPTGWSSKAQYTGGNTGVIAWSIGQLDQATTSDSDGYRTGNEIQLRSFWIKGQLECSAASNMNIRLLLVRTNGLLTPDSLGENSIFGASTTPDLYGFINHGKAGRVKQILYDKIFTLQKRDDTSTKSTRFINLFRKVNRKLFYGEDTIGVGTGTNRRDVVLGTPQYYMVMLTDEVTNTLGGSFQMLTNYVP